MGALHVERIRNIPLYVYKIFFIFVILLIAYLTNCYWFLAKMWSSFVDWILATPPYVYETFAIMMAFASLGYAYVGYHYYLRYRRRKNKKTNREGSNADTNIQTMKNLLKLPTENNREKQKIG